MTAGSTGLPHRHILPLFFWAALTAPRGLSLERAAANAAVLIQAVRALVTDGETMVLDLLGHLFTP